MKHYLFVATGSLCQRPTFAAGSVHTRHMEFHLRVFSCHKRERAKKNVVAFALNKQSRATEAEGTASQRLPLTIGKEVDIDDVVHCGMTVVATEITRQVVDQLIGNGNHRFGFV